MIMVICMVLLKAREAIKKLFPSANNNFIASQSHFICLFKPQAKLVLPVLVALIESLRCRRRTTGMEYG
jgi:hypothetical protein